MGRIDPIYNLVNTILDDKEVVIFLGAGASMEGTQEEKRFPSFDELIDKILEKFGFDPKEKKEKFENFLTVIRKWEQAGTLSSRLSEYLDGEPGLAHYYLAALSIALFSESNALLYLTTNYDNLMNRAFSELERNPVRRFTMNARSLPPYITGSEFQQIVNNMEDHMKKGRPFILKLFGDLNSQNPIFRQEDMKFEPTVEEQLIEWMKRPMVVIGYSFSDNIMEELLIAARGVLPVFIVTPTDKKIPPSINNLERVHHIKKSFSEFILDLLEVFKEKNPTIIEKTDQILEPYIKIPERPPKELVRHETKPTVSPNNSDKIKQKKILILAANPKTTPPLRLDEEVREIEEGVKRAKYRDQLIIHQKWAVGLRDLRRALLDNEPQIVHFAGHGKRDGLLVEDELGMAVLISAKALSGLFELFSDQVECVILSACYSAPQANAINKHINYVIGMRREIKDKAAIEFTVGFYDALGAGKSIEEAFKFGRAAILATFPDLQEHLIPVLKMK